MQGIQQGLFGRRPCNLYYSVGLLGLLAFLSLILVGFGLGYAESALGGDPTAPKRLLGDYGKRKGAVDAGVRALCRVYPETIVVGEPAVLVMGIANVGREDVLVVGDGFGEASGYEPVKCIVDPTGAEFTYLGPYWVSGGHSARRGVSLSPGDTLKIVQRVSHYRDDELVFPYAGRWGVYIVYSMPESLEELKGFKSLHVESEVGWVDVVDRDSTARAAWAVFGRAQKHFAYYGDVCADSIPLALDEVIQRH